MHRTLMEPIMILILAGAGFQLAVTAETGKDVSGGKYNKPVVYTNLPPPVLYFPNFPEKSAISERGDEEDKRVEYVPFPFKELPLLVYQSDNQPPVHVVQQQQQTAGSNAGANEPSSAPPRDETQPNQQSGQAVYMQNNGQQYQNVQMYPVAQDNSNNPSANVGGQDMFPNLQNQQIISIGLSAIHDMLGNAVYSDPQPASNPTSHYQQDQNSQYNGAQNVNQYSSQQAASYQLQNAPSQMQVEQPQHSQYYLRQNGDHQYSQPPMQNSQQAPTSQLNSNNQVMPQAQQNMIPQYDEGGVSMQYHRQVQYPRENPRPQVHQVPSYMQQNQAQMQYAQSNSQQPSAYTQQSNSQQSPSSGMHMFYQQSGNTHQNLNSVQHTSVSNAQPTSSRYQQQVGNGMIPNMHQQTRQYQQIQTQSPMQTINEEYSAENEPQYISIAVYPHGSDQTQEPEQYYKIAIPPPIDAYEEESNEEPEKNGANENSMEVNKAKHQKMQAQKQTQSSRYAGSSPQAGENTNLRRPLDMHYTKQNPSNINSKNQKPTNFNNNQQSSDNNNSNQPRQLNKYNMNKQQNSKDTTQKKETMHKQEHQVSENPSEEQPNYQQILIHIPHTVDSAPQILVQPGDNDQPSISYMGSVQGNDQMKSSMYNLREPQYASSNYGYRLANYLPQNINGVGFNQRFARPKSLPKYAPVDYASAATNTYTQNTFGNLFGPHFGKYKNKPPIMPIGTAHPGIYASSNVHFTSLNPLFVPNPLRNMPRIPHMMPFNQMGATMLRPRFLPNPMMPMNNVFHSSYPDEMMAQASFNAPRITRSHRGDFNDTELREGVSAEEFANQYSSSTEDHIIKSLAEKSTEALFKQIARDVLTHDVLDGVLSTSNMKQTGVGSFNAPQSPGMNYFNYGGQLPLFLLPSQSFQQSNGNVQPSNAGGGKYGNFMKKLAALSSSLISQSLGMNKPVTFREETKVKHSSGEYSVEEMIESLLPQNASPRISTANQGTSAPSKEISKRVSKTEAKPPIIVYKGPKPPVEVYGNKEDIETTKDSDSVGVSANAQDAVSRMEDDLNDPDQVMDYIDMMYSMLPDFIKHTIGKGQGEIGLPSPELISAAKEGEASSNKTEASVSTSDSTDSSKTLTSAFKEDIEELAKLFNREEKSDIIPF